MPDFTPSVARSVSNDIIFGEVSECLYCDVSPPPILFVSSDFIEFTCHIQLYSRTSCTFLHSYIHVIIHLYIHTYTTYIHNYSYMIALVTQSFVWLYFFSSILTQTASGSFFTETTFKYIQFCHKCHPQYVWSRDATHHKTSVCLQLS